MVYCQACNTPLTNRKQTIRDHILKAETHQKNMKKWLKGDDRQKTLETIKSIDQTISKMEKKHLPGGQKAFCPPGRCFFFILLMVWSIDLLVDLGTTLSRLDTSSKFANFMEKTMQVPLPANCPYAERNIEKTRLIRNGHTEFFHLLIEMGIVMELGFELCLACYELEGDGSFIIYASNIILHIYDKVMDPTLKQVYRLYGIQVNIDPNDPNI
eukprot:Awhi_evm1s237